MAFPLTIPTKREMTGGDLLAQCLKKIGTEVAFGLHGGHLDAFLVGCEEIGIRLVDTRHETVAVQAAESYSKMTGKMGVCFVTANSGFANGLPGLATAFADRSPILCITSSVPLRDQENNSLQGHLDQIVVAKPLTKFAHRVVSAEDLPRLVAHAMHISTSGAPGPVLLDIPIDILFAPLTPPLISWGAISAPPPTPPGPSPSAIDAAVTLLLSSHRPALILGTGAASPQATTALSTLLSHTPLPTFHTGKFATLGLPTALIPTLPHPPDTVLLLGARTGLYLGGRSGAIIPPSAKLIHIDVDAGELGRTLPAAVGIVSDATAFVHALSTALTTSTQKLVVAEEWRKVVKEAGERASPFDAAPPLDAATGALHPHHALKALFTALPREREVLVVLDGGEAALWAGPIAASTRPAALVSSTGHLGFLGNGFGYALGLALARPEAQIVFVTGDGAAGFHFMELDSYARHGAMVLTVVVNNAAWGMSVNGQDLVYEGKTGVRPVSELVGGRVDFGKVAEGLGVVGVRVGDGGGDGAERLEAVGRGVRSVVERGGGLGCVDLRVGRKPAHPVTEAMVGATGSEDVVVVPYYDNVPRAYYKL